MNLSNRKGNAIMTNDLDFEDIKFTDGEPPVSLDQDPKPKAAPKKTTPKTGAKPTRTRNTTRSNAINELQENIEGFLFMLAVPIKMRDIHPDGSSCADLTLALDDKGMNLTVQAKQLAFALAQVGIDNTYIKKFFSMGDDAGKWVMLLQALQPFIMTTYSNHIGPRRAVNGTGNDFVE
jgi:hypothetical protein